MVLPDILINFAVEIISVNLYPRIILLVVMAIKIKCNLVPKGMCLNLFGLYLTPDVSMIDRHVENHERIHTAQQKELLFIPFYILYILEWLVLLCRYRNWDEAYMNVSFEREAYAHGRDLSYLSHRHHYAQWRKEYSAQKAAAI